MMLLLFIVGVGRSGTSLLQSMFAAHPRLEYMPETSFIRRYVVGNRLLKLFNAAGKAAVIQKLEEDVLFARTGLDVSSLVGSALEQNGDLDRNIYCQMVLATASQAGTSWVGDKDPRLIEFLPLLRNVLPDAQVVNIIRDPRDVLVSKKNAAWSKHGHVWKHVFANRVQLKLGRSFGHKRFAQNYHELLYEELIASPRDVLNDLCEKIGLPFDEAMLSFGEAAKKLVAQSEESWKKDIAADA